MSVLISQVTNKSQFLRVYKKASKSPWDDSSTVLLLADIILNKDKSISLGFESYAYLHRSTAGCNLGVSISKKLLRDNTEFEAQSQYLEGAEMYAFLLLYIDDIQQFCENFAEEFFSVFLLPVSVFFRHAEKSWLEHIETMN
jgi:hypothetical protein